MPKTDPTVITSLRMKRSLLLKIKQAQRMLGSPAFTPTFADTVRWCLLQGAEQVISRLKMQKCRKKPLLQDAATVARDLRRLARRRFGKAAAVVS